MRDKHGLRRDASVILISAGGFGIGQVDEVLASLLQLRHPAEIVTVCGQNEELKARVDRLAGDVPAASRVTLKAVGYTTAMDEYMAASDFVVGKPGGLTMSEALACGKVFVVVNPIPGQEAQTPITSSKRGPRSAATTCRSSRTKSTVCSMTLSGSRACGKRFAVWHAREQPMKSSPNSNRSKACLDEPMGVRPALP